MPGTTYQNLKDRLDRKVRGLKEECNRPGASVWLRERRASGILELTYQDLKDESEPEELTKVAKCFLGGALKGLKESSKKADYYAHLHRKFMEGEADV